MLTLPDLLIVVSVLAFAYGGWRIGIEAASFAALEVVACLVAGVILHETVAGWLFAAASGLMGDWASQSWCVLLAFALLAWGGFAGVRLWFHRTSPKDEEDFDIDPLGDRLGGAVAGAFGGAALVGGALVTLSMIPWLAWLKPTGDQMLLDVGKMVLRTGGQLAWDQHGDRSIPVLGEPPARSTNPAARLTSEPWFDADDDGKFTEADRYRDVDGNGTFTKDLYFEDLDGDGLRRVGMVDKYMAGRWDGGLRSDDRPRPEQAKSGDSPSRGAQTSGTSRPPQAPSPDRKDPAKTGGPKQKPVKPKPGPPQPDEKEPADDF